MTIPKNAKRVFKGILFDVYQWPQKQFDGTYKTFEMIARKPTVDIIATAGKKIIILKQRQPRSQEYYSFPAGRIEENETPKECAIRELEEETGYSTKTMSAYKMFKGSAKIYFPEYMFIARECKKTSSKHLDGGEKICVTFMDFNEFLQLCKKRFIGPREFQKIMYECLMDRNKKEKLRKKIFEKKRRRYK